MYYLGIDLGGTNIAAGVADQNYNIIGRAKIKTKIPRPANQIVDDMVKAAEEAVKNAGIGIGSIEWIGVGSPGTVNKNRGIIEYSCNLDFHSLPMAQMIRERTGLDCYVENDANAAAYGELLAGAGKGVRDFIAVTIGTGIGGGVIIDGQMLHGHNFAGGELGHTVIVTDGEPCSCGRRGCFEAYASATALIRQTKAAMDSDRLSLMWKIADERGKISARTSFDAMRLGDPTARDVVERYIKYVACGITNIVNIFRPEVLCIGGGVSNEGDYIIKPIAEYVDRECYGSGKESHTRIAAAELGGDAGIIGAAFLGNLK
jgi:glucokinase